MEKYVVGIDFGSLSGRALVVRVSDGAELADAVHGYPHAVMSEELPSGVRLAPDWALQHPGDYISVLKHAVPAAITAARIDPSDVIGVATDFTACTVLPVLADGTPLSELPEFQDRPHAYVKLWKHHAAQGQADRINELAHQRSELWIGRYGGLISSEWEFAKALQVLEEDPEIYQRMDHWVEAADWIVWQLTGVYTRNSCTAGYKGIYQDGQYPNRDYLAALNPDFIDFVEQKLDHPISQLGERAGNLTAEAAQWTGLPEGIAVAVGNVDAHVTVPAARANAPGHMVAIMGTSTCHVMNAPELHEVPGMCGVVADGITPGYYGYEAGQSGVGDILAWFVENQVPGHLHDEAKERGVSIHTHLIELSENEPVGAHGLLALDWHSGNRSVLVNHDLSGMILGLTLSTKPEQIYRSLVESTAFGTRKIVETFNAAGVEVTDFIGAGGLIKNPVLMQIYSDVLGMPIHIIGSDQGPALGAALHAAVAAGAYKTIEEASEMMGKLDRDVYRPRAKAHATYSRIYEHYSRLHDYFGRGENNVLLDLKNLRNQALRNDSEKEATHDS